MIKFKLIIFFLFFQFANNNLIYANVPLNYSSLIQQILDTKGQEFDSLEHKAITEEVLVKFRQNDRGVMNPVFLLPNGLLLNYSQIVMLGGDFFAVAKQPISSCESSDQIYCFENAFAELAIKGSSSETKCQSSYVKATSILNFYNQVEIDLQAARHAGMKDWEFYHKYSGDFNKKLNKLTCGGGFLSAYFPFGSYLKITQNNLDHFVPQALTAYKAGHQAAIIQAIAAYKEFHQKGNEDKAQQLLQLAYAKNAFALHYLTDALSSGHMRVPRKKIKETIALPHILTLLLSNHMHDEDSRIGLNVINHKGVKWRAYGDGYNLKEADGKHHQISKQIIQMSTDAIFKAYQTGRQPTRFAELAWMPDYSKLDTLNNHSPLFKILDGKVALRTSLFDHTVHQWTTFWNGLITLMHLSSHSS